MFTERGNVRPIEVISVDNEDGEAAHIIESLKAQRSFKDCAVLCRNNADNLILANELLKHTIPFYIKERDEKFFDSMIVQDIRAFIKLSLDNTDYASYKRICYRNDLFLSKDIVESSRKGKSSWSLDYLENITWPNKSTENVSDYLNAFELISRASFKDIISTIFNETGYGKYLRKNSGFLNYSDRYVRGVKHILSSITQDCQNIESVLTRLDDLKDTLKKSSDRRGENVVTLSTIHGDKGLEWENVYMMSMVNEIIPSLQAIEDQRAGNISVMEEERRLFYVGITRAKSYLDIIVPSSINGSDTSISKFASEIKKIKRNKDIKPVNLTPINIDKTIALSSNINTGDKLYHKGFEEGEIVAIDIESDTFIIEFSGQVQKIFKLQSLSGGFFQRINS